MTCELVTGSAGTDHVSSADDGSMFASVFGPGRYVVKQGSDFNAALIDANNVYIGTGAGFMDGRYFRVTAAETLTIDSGSQGNNRIDLVGVKYLYDSGTGVETCSLAVVKGTPTSGTPSTPSYTDGNINLGATEAFFPLYELRLTGITPSDPVKVFDIMQGTVSCPWPVGSVLQMTNAMNPNDVYPGTTWQKISGVFLLGSSSSHALGQIGGAESTQLELHHIPIHDHTYSKPNSTSGSTTLTTSQIPSHSHNIRSNNSVPLSSYGVSDASWSGSSSGLKLFTDSNATAGRLSYVDATQNAGGGQGHTHSIGTTYFDTGQTGAVNPTPVATMPPYKVVNMWERTA